jgi:hypothetical protein
MRTPTRLESSEERARSRNIASYMDWSCWGSEVDPGKFNGHVLEVRIPVRSAIKPRVREARRIMGLHGSHFLMQLLMLATAPTVIESSFTCGKALSATAQRKQRRSE